MSRWARGWIDVLTDMFYHKHRRLMVVSWRCCARTGVLTDNNELPPDFSGHGMRIWMGVLGWIGVSIGAVLDIGV